MKKIFGGFAAKYFEEDMKMLPPFKREEARKFSDDASGLSVQLHGKAAAPATIHGQVLEALQMLSFLYEKKLGGVIKTDDGWVITQTPLTDPATLINEGRSDRNVICAWHPSTGGVMAAIRTSEGQFLPYELASFTEKGKGKRGEKATPLIAAILTEADLGQEQFLNTQKLCCFSGSCGEEEKDFLFFSAAHISDVLRCKCLEPDACEGLVPGSGIRMNLPSPNVTLLTKGKLASFSFNYETYQGHIEEIDRSVTEKHEAEVKKEELGQELEKFLGKYDPDPERVLTPEEELLVPSFPEGFQVSETAEKVARSVHDTTDLPSPVRNVILFGVSGTGKTEDVKMIARGLRRPYVAYTCSSDTEGIDLLRQIIPYCVNKDGEEVPASELEAGLPGIMDMIMDPEDALEQLTGEKCPGATAEDCLKAYSGKVLERAHESGMQFTYVDSPIVQAAKYGYVCEIQEPTVMLKPGALVGLNALFDKSQSIRLVTGETIKRHPDTVYILTTNVDYEGCRPLNQSIWSRMQMKIHVKAPADDVLAERVRNQSGYTDMATIRKMVAVYNSIREVCAEQGISSGSCDVRALISWATQTMITREPYHAALDTIIPSVSMYEEDWETVLPCLNTQF